MNLIIDDSEIFNAIFDNSNPLFEVNVILDISQPMIFELLYNDEVYLIYVLRDTSKLINGRLVTVNELLVSQVNKNVVSMLIDNEISIFDSFMTSSNIWRVGKVGNKIFPRKVLKDSSEIEDRFPIQSLMLKNLPNRAMRR